MQRFNRSSSSTTNSNAPSPSIGTRRSPYSLRTRSGNSSFSSTWRSPSTTTSCASPNPTQHPSFLDTCPEDVSVERPFTRSACGPQPTQADVNRPSTSSNQPPTTLNRPSFFFSARHPLPNNLNPFVKLDTLSPSIFGKPQILKKSPFPSLTRELNNEAKEAACTSSTHQPTTSTSDSSDSETMQKWATAFGVQKWIQNQENGGNSSPTPSTQIAGGSTSFQNRPNPTANTPTPSFASLASQATSFIPINSSSTSSTPSFSLSAPAFIPFARITSSSTPPAPDIVQQTTKKLHSMSLRSHKPSAPAPPPSTIQMDTGIGNEITLHYSTHPPAPPTTAKPSVLKRPTLVPGVFGYKPAESSSATQPSRTIPQFPPPLPPVNTFRGLSNTVYDNSFSVHLTLKLEENYNKCRVQVLSRDGFLITPLKFLTNVCSRMDLQIHSEVFRFTTSQNDIQWRTELFVGGFCGVAHAQSKMMSKQLAAAHILERMRIHFRKIKPDMYALFPGGRYNRIGDRLKNLCQQYDLGEVQTEVKDRWQNIQRGRGVGWRKEDEIRWECSCFVKKYQSVVLSDHKAYGLNLAQKQMYLNFVKPPEVSVIQIQDYFGIGVDCPMLKDIHASLLLNAPSFDKRQWLIECAVPETQMDAVLHDPTNSSKYLLARPVNGQANAVLEGAKLQEFKRGLEDAVDWIEREVRRGYGMTLRRRQRNWGEERKRELEDPQRMDIEGDSGLVGDGAELNGDEDDAEVEDLFLDAVTDEFEFEV